MARKKEHKLKLSKKKKYAIPLDDSELTESDVIK